MAHELHLANNYRFHCVEGQKKKKPWRWVIQMEQNEKKKENCHRTNRLQIRADRQ